MSRYLFDTSVLIDLSHGLEPTRSKVRRLIEAGDEIGVCAVVVTEFVAGLRPEHVDSWQHILPSLVFWETSIQAAAQAGRYRYELRRLGRTITTVDALVAATAREWFATVATENVKDFPMTDVRLISFREPLA